MKKFFTVKNISILGILTAIVVVLQTLSNYISFGPVSITLSLIPIAVGALLLGPIGGAFLGLINGVIVLLAPSTQGFLNINVWATILICLVKTTLAGMVAGFIFMPFKKMNKNLLLGSILASISIPLINTGLFAAGSILFFQGLLESIRSSLGYENIYAALFLGIIGINFIIEFTVNSVLSPVVYRITTIWMKRNKEKKTNENEL